MAIVMLMSWDDVTPAQYDQLRELVRWETEVPEGGMFHVAAFDDAGIRITDVWESAEDFQRFTEQRLMPGVQQAGLPGEPNIEIFPVHAVFAPAYTPAR